MIWLVIYVHRGLASLPSTSAEIFLVEGTLKGGRLPRLSFGFKMKLGKRIKTESEL